MSNTFTTNAAVFGPDLDKFMDRFEKVYKEYEQGTDVGLSYVPVFPGFVTEYNLKNLSGYCEVAGYRKFSDHALIHFLGSDWADGVIKEIIDKSGLNISFFFDHQFEDYYYSTDSERKFLSPSAWSYKMID